MEKPNYVDQNKEAYELKTCACAELVSIKGKVIDRTEQNRCLFENFTKHLHVCHEDKQHNITQCTNMAVDGVVIKCSRICNYTCILFQWWRWL